MCFGGKGGAGHKDLPNSCQYIVIHIIYIYIIHIYSHFARMFAVKMLRDFSFEISTCERLFKWKLNDGLVRLQSTYYIYTH